MVRYEDIPDMVLCLLYIYQLLRLATAKDEHFKKPFFILFIVTGESSFINPIKRKRSMAGVYSVMTVFSYHILANFRFSERRWTIFFVKPLFVWKQKEY